MPKPSLSDDAIVMRRPDLNGLPENRPPADYSLRSFEAGDEAAWADLLTLAFPEEPWTVARLHEVFLDQPLWQPARVVFLSSDDRLVACTAAWHDPWCGPETGMIHWVATHPDYRGHGLGRAIVVAALDRMRDLGYVAAALITQVYRVPAIRLYLGLGFSPDMDAAADMEARWAQVEASLHRGEPGV